MVEASTRISAICLAIKVFRKIGSRASSFQSASVVMEEEGITEALIADRHFEQAGFTVLLK
jgi:predicted nucleic acid-binding protein